MMKLPKRKEMPKIKTNNKPKKNFQVKTTATSLSMSMEMMERV